MPAPQYTDTGRRCTCGWTTFREFSEITEDLVQRWVLFTGGGAGATAGGISAGAGEGTWGLFEVSKRTVTRIIRCSSCTRVRDNPVISVGAVVGGYPSGDGFYVVASDVLGTGCFMLEFRGPETHLINLKKTADSVESIVMDKEALSTAVAPPVDGVVAGVFRAQLPTALPGTYAVTFKDSCSDFELSLGSVTL